MTETKVVTSAQLDDLDALFCANTPADRCWCMWHIIAVKAFHEGGPEQNRAQLMDLAQTEDMPIGILAYQDNEPVGWCAVGPRERYARAIKTPSYRPSYQRSYQHFYQHNGEEPLTNVWLVPCFIVRSDVRGQGLSKTLLAAAVELASSNDAQAVDGFPFTGDKRRSSSQIHVGFESAFLACGFEPIRRPSDSRVVMRLVL